MRTLLVALVLIALAPGSSVAQSRYFAGAVTGLATLSADAQFPMMPVPAASGYKPENGPTLSPFIGIHLNDFLSLQASYIWNRNDVRFHAIQGLAFYDQDSRASQHLAVVDAMVYFRSRTSRVRPYLAAGIGLGHLSTSAGASTGMLAGAPGNFSATRAVLNVPVGVDVRVRGGWRFRYSFAETIQSNPLSSRLMPAGERGLKGFRNFFGFLKEF